MDNLALLRGILGPGVAGAVFGVGWWFWVDAVVCSAVQVSFLHYLPAGAVGLLVQDALTDKGPSVWTGVAGVLQCVLVLISGVNLLDLPQ
ncbi:hypothetical protein OsJ_27629 [Oryza sativa Japonica Group]|uniref:Uncharacterized protein n=1 Tax=Oryza sativa subsp. japonica TaxID=39947 RepID=B9G1C5_ORYSJ|nr:hypothetical protein OsJ_27629 [Oryza sativa Japonica Group]